MDSFQHLASFGESMVKHKCHRNVRSAQNFEKLNDGHRSIGTACAALMERECGRGAAKPLPDRILLLLQFNGVHDSHTADLLDWTSDCNSR